MLWLSNTHVFFLCRLARAGPRSEPTAYEVVKIDGCFRRSDEAPRGVRSNHFSSNLQLIRRTRGRDDVIPLHTISGNDIVSWSLNYWYKILSNDVISYVASTTVLKLFDIITSWSHHNPFSMIRLDSDWLRPDNPSAEDRQSADRCQYTGVQNPPLDWRQDHRLRPENWYRGRLHDGWGAQSQSLHLHAQRRCALGDRGPASKWVFLT